MPRTDCGEACTERQLLITLPDGTKHCVHKDDYPGLSNELAAFYAIFACHLEEEPNTEKP